jgi:hypothetical protein
MTDFTEDQLKALSTAVVLAPKGFALEPDRVEEIETCNSLVVSGHLTAIEGIEEGYGYRASDELIAAMAVHVEDKAERASQN